MRRTVAWPGVKPVKAKGRVYHYWTRSKPWVRLPDPGKDPDGFMRKLAACQRVDAARKEQRVGTLAQSITLYKKHPDFTDRAANTQKLYGIYFAELCQIFPEASLHEITPQLVRRYVMDENADRRGAANMMLKMLHIVYKWASERRSGLTDPTKGIKLYKIGEHEPWPDHVIDAALTSPDAAFRRAVKLHLYTGQRTGDVCRTAWNVVTADQRIPVKQQKTGTPLLIPIHPDLRGELSMTPKTAITILTNRTGGPLQPQTFSKWVADFAAKHKVKLVPHGLRKNAVIGLLEAECSTAEVSSITGQSLGEVERYARLRNQGRIAVGAMEKWSAAQRANGKTFPDMENSVTKIRK